VKIELFLIIFALLNNNEEKDKIEKKLAHTKFRWNIPDDMDIVKPRGDEQLPPKLVLCRIHILFYIV